MNDLSRKYDNTVLLAITQYTDCMKFTWNSAIVAEIESDWPKVASMTDSAAVKCCNTWTMIGETNETWLKCK